MSQANPSSVPSHQAGDRSVTTTWDLTNFNPGDVFVPIGSPGRSDRTVQLSGDFGGCTVVIEGTNSNVQSENGNDGVWVTLSDVSGSALSFTSAALKQISEMTRFIRPRVSAGASTSVKVMLLAKEAI